jgi:hypothetical protein
MGGSNLVRVAWPPTSHPETRVVQRSTGGKKAFEIVR